MNFTKALLIATEAHKGTYDKGGEEYIKHPLHLAFKLKEQGYGEKYQIVALLHDVVEDTDITLDDLRIAGFHSKVIIAIKKMTHIIDKDFIKEYEKEHIKDFHTPLEVINIKSDTKEKEYLRYVADLGKNDIARVVKMEDLKHNSDITRIPFSKTGNFMDDMTSDSKIAPRLYKYAKAMRILKEM